MAIAPVRIAQVVGTVRSWGIAPDEFTLVESVEAAVGDGQEGLTLEWTQTTRDQGVRHFGLVVAVDDIATYAERLGIDQVLADLHLMLIEPHPTEADGHTRTWFRSVRNFIA